MKPLIFSSPDIVPTLPLEYRSLSVLPILFVVEDVIDILDIPSYPTMYKITVAEIERR